MRFIEAAGAGSHSILGSRPTQETGPEGAVTIGTFHGIGLGPGDPELLTVKAVRLIAAAPVVAYFAKKGRRGNARGIVDQWLAPGVQELPLEYPVTTEIHFNDRAYIDELARFYEASAARIGAILTSGRDVALVCEGDPMFYGSFMHLYVRLTGQYRVSVTPGVTGMSGCWSAAGAPITWGDDILSVLPGTLPEADLVVRLKDTDAAVIMKLGSNFAKVRSAIEAAGLTSRAIYVERGTMAGEKIMPLADKPDDSAPYFSLILIPGNGRRP
jgi:precorrin-2/cobalt-factor-2 C20-methyltransferase